MSFQANGGGYAPTGFPQQNGGSSGERSPKRQKMSPPAPTFKLPQAPAQRAFQQQQANQNGTKQPQQEEQEKRADISDIGDLLFGSGIDEKTEEEFMSQSYRRQQQTASQPRPSQYGQQTLPQQQQQPTSFDLLSGSPFQSIGQRPGNLGPPVKSSEDVVQETEQKRQAEIRAYNERTQRPMEDPFLWGNSMRFRMEKIANESGIKIPMQGLFDKINNKPPDKADTKELKHKEEGGGSIVAAEKAPSILNKNVALDAIMSLMSLAANERIRNLLEDAYALTRGRQLGADGVVPEEYTDLAVTSDAQHSQQQLPNGNSHPPSVPPKPISVAAFLAQVTRADRQAEEVRLKKRAERKARKEAAAASGTGLVNGDGVSPSDPLSAGSGNTPGPAGLIAPEGPKMTKKEREKLAKQDVSEEVQMKQANTALNMALGGGKKKYSWLTGGNKGGGSGVGTPGLGASRSGTPGMGGASRAKIKAESEVSPIGKDGLPSKELDRKYGVWREDGPGGKDVQLRDWVTALDYDGREKRTLASAMLKLGRERLLDDDQA